MAGKKKPSQVKPPATTVNPAGSPKVKSGKRVRTGMCEHRLPDTAYCSRCDS